MFGSNERVEGKGMRGGAITLSLFGFESRDDFNGGKTNLLFYSLITLNYSLITLTFLVTAYVRKFKKMYLK